MQLTLVKIPRSFHVPDGPWGVRKMIDLRAIRHVWMTFLSYLGMHLATASGPLCSNSQMLLKPLFHAGSRA